MTNDRRAINQALQALPHAERTRVLQRALQAALDRMPAEQAQRVVSAAGHLSKRVNKLGPTTAIEILAAIGVLWNENGHEG